MERLISHGLMMRRLSGEAARIYSETKESFRKAAAGRLGLVADSTGRRNTLAKAFRRCLEAQPLSRAFVQSTSDGIELALANIR